jgi:hypothetical protein
MQVILFSREDATTETRFVLPQTCRTRTKNGSFVNWESPCTVTVAGVPGPAMEVVTFDSPKPIRYVLMSKERAGEVWDVLSPFGQLVASTSLRFIDSMVEEGRTLATIQAQDRSFYLYLLAPKKPAFEGPFTEMQEDYDAEFGLYKATGKIDFPVPSLEFQRSHEGKDLILETELSKKILNPAFVDLCLEARFDGTLGLAYLGDELISDHAYGRFLEWEIHLRDRLAETGAGKLRLVFRDAHHAEVEVKPVIETSATLKWS